MTEAVSSPGGGSAGAQLRAARERQGLHIAALAAAIKIPQRKLEALEADRFDELPDATFTRALAMTVCRALKIDPAPVLAQLPQGGPQGLGKVNGSLNTPFRDRPGRSNDAAERGPLRHPLAWAALAVVVVAALLYLSPAEWWASFSTGTSGDAASASAPAASEPVTSVVAVAAHDSAASMPEAAASAPPVEAAPSAVATDAAASAAAPDVPAGLAVLSASDASWVEVIDADGKVLVQRVLRPGESLGLDGRLPFRLKIGNAAVTQLQFRGQVVDLTALTRDNVARLELK